jgi:hypothetical protein
MAALCCLPIMAKPAPWKRRCEARSRGQAHQACSIKGVDTLRRDKRLPGADRIKTRVTGAAALDGSVVTGKGGAVRAKGRWYALKFTCTVTADRMKAVSFTYELGQEIPEAKWTTTACGAEAGNLHDAALARPARFSTLCECGRASRAPGGCWL